MTAEIAVMNKQGIALAADSAVTISTDGGPKIYSSANKIFALSKYRPVGIMIHNQAEVLELPWETAIKTYRKELKQREYSSLWEYVQGFITWMGTNRRLFPQQVQRDYMTRCVRSFYRFNIVKEIREAVDKEIEREGSISVSDVERLTGRVIKRHHDRWKRAAPLPHLPEGHEAEVRKSYEAMVEKEARSAFEKLPLSEDAIKQLVSIAVFLVSRTPPEATTPKSVTGIVIAGYGSDDLFPSLVELSVHGIVNDQLVSWPTRIEGVDRANDAHVSAFAQAEMVARFMEGVDPDYQEAIEESLEQIMAGYTTEIYRALGGRRPSAAVRKQIDDARRSMLEDYGNRLAQARHDVYVSSVVRAVASLPVDELAGMAEALVNLTSFKRKVSMEAESVSGPIDVAVITPGDGFIWIKRKHYFEPDRNPQFLANYYRED